MAQSAVKTKTADCPLRELPTEKEPRMEPDSPVIELLAAPRSAVAPVVRKTAANHGARSPLAQRCAVGARARQTGVGCDHRRLELSRSAGRRESPGGRACINRNPKPLPPHPTNRANSRVRKRPSACEPPRDTVLFKDRLLYLLQPPLEDLFAGRQVTVPFQPFPYQLEGIAFLMPRHAALLADEMGLGKTVQAILALRLLFHTGMIHKALLVCPKPLVNNWSRELRTWADGPAVRGHRRRHATLAALAWMVSNCPLKLVNYELLTRDAGHRRPTSAYASTWSCSTRRSASRTANRRRPQVVRGLHRERSWAMTGTPIENKPEDLVNMFAFVDPGRIPPDTPAKQLPSLTGDCILRRVKEDVMTDMPPKIIRDAVPGTDAGAARGRTTWPRRKASSTSTRWATRSRCSTSSSW